MAYDNAVVHRLIGSQMFLNEFVFCRWVKKGTENTIQFLFYDYISYYRNGYKSCYRLVISRQLWLRIGQMEKYKKLHEQNNEDNK